MVKAGKSDKKLLSRICLARRGKKGRKNDEACHAEHIAEIGADGGKDILHGIGKSLPSQDDTAAKVFQVRFQQHEIGSLFSHIHRCIHGDADVSGVESRGIVYPIAHESDDVPHIFEYLDNAFLVTGINFGEHVRGVGYLPQGFIGHLRHVSARYYSR